MKIGFIGAGNMSAAIIRGAVKNGVKPDEIYASRGKASILKDELGINLCLSNEEILENCEIIILGVKPHLIREVLEPLKGLLNSSKHVLVSIAAGISIDMLEEFAGVRGISIIRVMPNVNVEVSQGMAAVCGNSAVKITDMEFVISLFNKIGKAIKLEENFFPIFAALAGSSPAFTYVYIDSLAKAAHKAGLPKKTALEIASQAVLGSAAMLSASGKHPWELADTVCSPGGTTIEGICALEENGFQTAVIKCLDACMHKDRLITERNRK